MVQGLLEGDKDSSPSVQNDRVGAIGRKANWRERKNARRAANQVKGGRRPSSRARAKAPTGARPGQGRPRGAIGRKANWRERKRCTGVRLDARPGQGRPRGAIGHKANWRERKKTRAKVVQLVLELLVPPRSRPATARNCSA